MIKNSYGFNLVKDFEETKKSVYDLDLIDGVNKPFKRKANEEGNYFVPESTAFINLSEATKVSKFFRKNGVYTKADPVYDKYEFDSFWDAEEEKRKNGITIPGELYRKEDGDYALRNIHITGEHYGYLNYARIKKVPDELESFGDEDVFKNKSASKKYEFPDFWDSDYYYFKAVELARTYGKHLVVAKARRKGYSYKNGWLCANRADLFPNTITGLAAYDKSSLFPEGTFLMTDNYLQFLSEHTDWKKGRLFDSENYIKFGYTLKSSPDIERGYKSVVLAEGFSKNPGVIRGKDADLILVEEAGKARNLQEFLDSTLPTLKAGKYVTGLMIVFGTGGGKDSYWEEFEELFYDPDTNDFMMFGNVFEDEGEDETCGYFVPDFANKEGFYDKWGNSNTIDAIEFELDYREKLKRKGKLKKLKDRGMEYCFKPREAFNRSSNNIFPREFINNQLYRIKNDKNIKYLSSNGKVFYNGNNAVFKDFKLMQKEDYDEYYNPPVTGLKINSSDNNNGSFIRYFPPHRVNGVVPENMYRIWHDPFSVDKEKGELTSKHSFGCFYVYQRTNQYSKGNGDRLVGVYIGRPETTEAFNDVMYNVAKYYNAKIFYEKNVGDVYTYFRNKQELNMLVDTPTNIFDKEDLSRTLNKPKGIHINGDKKLNGAIFLKDWLLKKVDKDKNGEWIRNIHYIFDEGLLKELLKWNLTGNFDRVSTLIVGMYDIKESYFEEVEEVLPDTYDTISDNIFDREWN